MKLLIADDARVIAEGVAFGAQLAWPGCEVVIAASGSEALQRFGELCPDLVVLDVEMPAPDGFEVCRRIRALSPVPILMLTVRDAVFDKVRALELGADDYLIKPFDHLELIARLKALARRPELAQARRQRQLLVGELALDPDTRQVLLRGAALALTSTEYHLLEVLMEHAGHVLPSEYLLTRVWGPDYSDAHNLKVFIRRLRQKLGDDPERPRYIFTEWGTGYRFAAH